MDSRRGIRHLLRWGWIYFLYCTGLLRWAERQIVAASGVIVLTLHRVLPQPEFENTPSPKGMVVQLETFARLLEFLKSRCELLDLSTERPHSRRNSKRPRVAVTFDDGWKDTFDVAFPL